MTEEGPDREELLAGQARIPPGVVRREFPTETIVLNLDTGQYHGLNPTAGRMLEAMEASPTVADAAARLAQDYDQPVERLEGDLVQLCSDLLARQLIEVRASAG